MAKDSASGNRLIANNKKAYYDYFIEDRGWYGALWN